MMEDVRIFADGRVIPYSPAGACYTLDEMKQAVGGGYIQIVETLDGRLMVLDEEGKLKGFPLNQAATALYRFGGDDPIVGDVLVCGPERIE